MADNTYTNISDLPTLSSVSSDTWAPVEISGKVGKKVDLAGLTEQSIENMATTDEMTPEEKAAFLGSAYIPVKGTDSVKNVALADIVPDTVVRDANYVHTDNNFTTTEKNKLNGIAAGAEVNVQSDWNATSGDAFIKNKPTIPSADGKTITLSDNKLSIAGMTDSEFKTYFHVPYTYHNQVKWGALSYSYLEDKPTLIPHCTIDEKDPEHGERIEGKWVPYDIGTTRKLESYGISPVYSDGWDGPNGTGGNKRDNNPIIHDGLMVLQLGDAESNELDYGVSCISFKDYDEFPWKEVADSEAPEPGYVYCTLSDLRRMAIIIPSSYHETAHNEGYLTDEYALFTHLIQLVKIDGSYTIDDIDVNIYYQQRSKAHRHSYDNDYADYVPLTCVSARTKVDPHKSGIIRITGTVFKILQ